MSDNYDSTDLSGIGGMNPSYDYGYYPDMSSYDYSGIYGNMSNYGGLDYPTDWQMAQYNYGGLLPGGGGQDAPSDLSSTGGGTSLNLGGLGNLLTGLLGSGLNAYGTSQLKAQPTTTTKTGVTTPTPGAFQQVPFLQNQMNQPLNPMSQAAYNQGANYWLGNQNPLTNLQSILGMTPQSLYPAQQYGQAETALKTGLNQNANLSIQDFLNQYGAGLNRSGTSDAMGGKYMANLQSQMNQALASLYGGQEAPAMQRAMTLAPQYQMMAGQMIPQMQASQLGYLQYPTDLQTNAAKYLTDLAYGRGATSTQTGLDKTTQTSASMLPYLMQMLGSSAQQAGAAEAQTGAANTSNNLISQLMSYLGG